MTRNERIIRDMIAKLEKRLAAIIELIDTPSAILIIQNRKNAQIWLDDLKARGLSNKTAEDDQALQSFAKEEKRLLNIMNKQKNLPKLIEERVDIEFDLAEYKNKLYWIERAKQAKSERV